MVSRVQSQPTEDVVMRSLLVPVEEHAFLGPTMDTAVMLGRQFGSYIEGIAVSPNIPAYITAEASIGDSSFLSATVRREKAAACRLHFETFMIARGVSPASMANSGLCSSWHEEDPVEDDVFGAYARTFDISVLGRPGDELNHPRAATTEAALFESGRPILIAPPISPQSLGERIGIAWNRSTETARTVALAMPMLSAAKEITVIEIEGWGVHGPSGQDLARSLRRHGMTVKTRTFSDTHRSSGGAILTAASALGCDLLIKGAYTQSRLRQMIFGGATSHILANTTVPVFMAH